MQKSASLAALRTELHRHDFSTFVDGEKTVAPRRQMELSCPAARSAKNRFGTMPQFLEHLTGDALPAMLDRLSESKSA
jgi:hypothetical protein